MLRKPLVLPRVLGRTDCSFGRIRGRHGGADRVGGGMAGMAGDVGGGNGLAGGAGGRSGRGIIRIASGGVGGERSGPRLGHGDLAKRPGPPRLDRLPRPVVIRVLVFEASEYMLGAVDGPEHQCPVILLVEVRAAFGAHQPSPLDAVIDYASRATQRSARSTPAVTASRTPTATSGMVKLFVWSKAMPASIGATDAGMLAEKSQP